MKKEFQITIMTKYIQDITASKKASFKAAEFQLHFLKDIARYTVLLELYI